MKRIVFAAIIAAVPLSARAQAPAPAKPPVSPDKMICKTESVTGSRLGSRRRCMTSQQWIEQRRVDQENFERARASGGGGDGRYGVTGG